MDLAKVYEPQKVERKWYEYWESNGLFHSEPDEREAYTIVIPPPNVTGKLHMGHILNNTLQDLLVRRARMMGFNACWVPGMDHASIATEAKVVQMLRKKGIKKSDLSRDEFMKHAWEWKENYGGIILEQLKSLGASCDWERTCFTMDEKLSKAVLKVFVDLHKKGFIYRGLKMVNWDPEAKTTLSNEEVIHKEEKSQLYYVRYPIEGTEEWITIATTRPETILGDTAICVNPKDERFTHLKGKYAIVPKVNRKIPIISDDYVDMEFGTGALKITPAHDTNDYEIGQKYDLQVIDIFNEDGTLSESAEHYIGSDRFEARKLILKDLEDDGFLVKSEEFDNKIGYSERTNSIVEPRLSLQWFVDMQKLVNPALDNVMNDEIAFYPPKYKNVYKHWMENIRDWPISRQLWWGQRIPAWYLPDSEYVVAETAEEALILAREKSGDPSLKMEDLRQDEDVVDTWFSSWLWPISVFDGFEESGQKELDYYYPTNVLVTGWDIIFFWVARMVMAGYEYKKERPFDHVYFTGMVRDKQHRKMSKQLGNSPEPMDLISSYGADGVRVGMLLCAPAGNDILFDDKLCEQGRNFSNKIWNALRLVNSWEIEETRNESNSKAIHWMKNRFQKVLREMNSSLKQYRISEALMSLYSLIWDDFCSWYLEMIKPEYQTPIDRYTLDETINIFEELMKLAHPFMPFVTEEVYHNLKAREDGDCIMIAKWPEELDFEENLEESGTVFKELVSKIREIRNKAGVARKDVSTLYINNDNDELYQSFHFLIEKLGIVKIEKGASEDLGSTSFVIGADKFSLETGIEVDVEEEKSKLEEELKYTEGFIKGVENKLKNKRFVDNAPEQVVEKERQKLADGYAKKNALIESLSRLS